MAGERSLCSDFPQSTEKKRCETRERQWVQCCRFLPMLGKLLLQKIRLCWRQRCNGSRNLNPDSCRGSAQITMAGMYSGSWTAYSQCFVAGAGWFKAGVGVFPVTTTFPSCCSADKPSCVHMHTLHSYPGRAWIHLPLPAASALWFC